MIFRSVLPRPGHTSEIKTNYKSAYVGALEPIMAELTEVGDASSSSTVAVSSGVSNRVERGRARVHKTLFLCRDAVTSLPMGAWGPILPTDPLLVPIIMKREVGASPTPLASPRRAEPLCPASI